MSDIEREFIAAVLGEGRMLDAVTAGITADFFSPDGDRVVNGQPVLSMNGRAWEWCLEQWRRHGATPSPDRLQREFPSFKLPPTTDPVSAYIEELQDRWALDRISRGISEALSSIDDNDHVLARKMLVTATQDIERMVSTSYDEDITEGASEWARERYLRYRDAHALKGVPFGFDHFDMITKGAQPKQLITLAGKAKTYKSFVLLHMFRSAFEYGVRPGLVGFEMTNDEQKERLYAAMASLPFAAVQGGGLTKPQKDKLLRTARGLEAYQPIIMSTDTNSAMTVSGLAAKCFLYKPRILFVDGVYMMDDEHGEPKGSPRALTNITRDLKRLAQNLNIPIVITTQALAWKSKKGITADSIGYTSSFVQDSDLVIMTDRDSSLDNDSEMFKLKCVMARSCPTFDIGLMWDWSTTTMVELGETDSRISDDEEV